MQKILQVELTPALASSIEFSVIVIPLKTSVSKICDGIELYIFNLQINIYYLLIIQMNIVSNY